MQHYLDDFGANQVLKMSASAKIIQLNGLLELKAWHLIGVSNGDIAAIQIKNTCTEMAGKLLVRHACDTQRLEPYSVEPGFLRNAKSLPLFETSNNIRRYVEGAYEANTNVFSGDLGLSSPSHDIRIHLDNSWPQGSMLLRIEGMPSPFGLFRSVIPGSDGVKPHQDMPAWEYPSLKFEAAKSNLAIVSFISPFEGGETNIFQHGILDKDLYDRLLQDGSDYGLDQKYLGEPFVTVKPKFKDTIIFNSGFAHSVNSVTENSTPRHTLSGFILHTPNHALELYI